MKTEDRVLVTIGTHRMPLRSIIHGKEIREAMAGMEKFRQKFNEKEFLYGARVYLDYRDGECYAILRRPETDKEYAERQAWLAEQAAKKAERKRLRELKAYEVEQRKIAEAAARKVQEEAQELARALEIAQKYGYKLVDKLDA